MICDVCDKEIDVAISGYICPSCEWDNGYQIARHSFRHNIASYVEHLPLEFMDEEYALQAIQEVYSVDARTAQSIIDNIGYYGEEE